MGRSYAPNPVFQFFGDDGKPLVFGFLCTYMAGTNTPVATYDSDGKPNEVKMRLNGRGETDTAIMLDADMAYKFVLLRPDGSEIWTRDNVTASGTSGTAGTDISAEHPITKKMVGSTALIGFDSTDIDKAISEETEARKKADKELSDDIGVIAKGLVTETNERKAADAELAKAIKAESKWAIVKATEASESLGKGNVSTKFPIQKESGNIDPAELESGIYFVSGTVRMIPKESSGVELAGKIQASIGGMPTQNVPFRLQDTRESVFAFSGLVPESSGSLAVSLALDGSGDDPGTYTFRLETLSVFKVTGISSGSGGSSNIRVLQYGETVSDFDTLSSYDLVLCTMNSKIFAMTELTGTAGTFVSDYMVGGSLRTNYTKLESSDGKTAGWSAITSTNADIDATTLDGLILTEAPVQKKLDSDSSHLVIYQDPVEASPLSRISTPPIDVIADSSSAAQGSGHGNGWTSVDMHVFSVQNYFVPKAGEDSFVYIVTQAQVGSVYNHQLGIYELDQENRKLHLVCLSGSCVSLDTTTGVKTVPVEYVSTAYPIIKPSRLYYAASFCDQTAVLVAGLKTNTFNLNPSSTDTPIGIWKSAVAYGSGSSEYTVDPSAVAEFDLSGFGMTAEHHFLALRHP